MPTAVPESYTGDGDWEALLTASMNAPKPAKKAKAEGDAASAGGSPGRLAKLKAALSADGEKPSKKAKIEVDFESLASTGT
jgi:hypothetical protein